MAGINPFISVSLKSKLLEGIVMHVPAGHSFPDATGVAFALGLGPPSLLAAIFIIIFRT